MTGHVTETGKSFAKHRQECEEAIRSLAPAGPTDSHRILQLRRELGDSLASFVLSVARLQTKARKKLDPNQPTQSPATAPIWWVTEKSLQQASAWQVARQKSAWFADQVVYDLCCGIGGDAIELARRGLSADTADRESELLVAVDVDEPTAQMAAANLHSAGVAGRSRVCCADAATFELPRNAAVHIDPDRRASGERKSSPDAYQPGWETVMGITMKAASAVVKLAPAAALESTNLAADKLGQAHRCWISLSGSVREQSLLWGDAIGRAGLSIGKRSAIALTADGSAAMFAPRTDDLAAPASASVARPRAFLVDPDAAIRAAGLTAAFTRMHSLQLLGRPSGFLTCDQLPERATVQMAVVGNVIWSGSCDDRKLRRELRSRGMYPAVIKVRGTQHDPAKLAKRYRHCGEQPVTLWIGRNSDRAYAAITA